MTPNEKPSRSAEGVLTVLQLPGIGPKTADLLCRTYATLDQIKDRAAHDRVDGVSNRALIGLGDEAHWTQAGDRARRVMEQAAKLGVRIVTAFDEGFPALLRPLSDRPLVLYVKGVLRSGLNNVACIGTRDPSVFGTEVTRRLVSFLAEQGWGIISGLAKGIDAESHRAALDVNGYTVAILANGLDKVYPSENRELADEIVAKGGALVSEQPFGIPAKPMNLVQRDRLQSGMSVATIVMQTDVVGGSMHTVRFTLSQGRFLVAPVPTGKHAQDIKSQGLIALTEQSGTVLAELLKANSEYRDVLLRRYANRAPAFPIRSRSDYPGLLDRLSKIAAVAEASPPSSRREAIQTYLAMVADLHSDECTLKADVTR